MLAPVRHTAPCATKPCHTRFTRLRAADFITHLVAITDTALAAMQGAMQAGRA